jgi:small-conductance mechanosensitive channel
MERLQMILELELYGGSLSQWVAALAVTALIVMMVRMAMPAVVRRLEALSKHTKVGLDDAAVNALKSTRLLLITLIAINVGSRVLTLPVNAQKVVDGVSTIALFLQVGLWLSALLQFWLHRSESRMRASNPGAVTSLAAVGFVGRLVLWLVMMLLVLDNLGINITALVAGLGVGGIAVALAVQNILGDLFASMSIVIDKPFVVGDFIIVDNFMGTVEHIGLKTTRLRSLDGEQIIFSNSDLLKTRLRNYKRMYERRVVFPLRLRYETTPEQVAKVPGLIKGLLEQHKQVRFERSHFFRFGESSLDLETVFWITTPDYNVYMDIQQELNLALMREFEKAGIEFAFPTRTLKTQEPLKVEQVHTAENGKDEPVEKREPEKRSPERH